MRSNIYIFAILLILSACDSTELQKKRIISIEETYGSDSFEAGLAYMTYIMKIEKDLNFCLELVDKLIRNNALMEARYALLHLDELYDDYRIHYLNAVCLRNLHQYEEAERSLEKALAIRSLPILEREMENILSGRESWKKIKEIEERIRESGLSPELRLERAKHLVYSGNMEAAILDLDSLTADKQLLEQSYDLKTRAYVFAGNYERADSVLQHWKNAVSGEKLDDLEKYSQSLNKIVDLKSSIRAGNIEASTYINLARELKEINAFTEAEKILDEGIARFPDNLNLQYASLLIYVESNQLDKAREAAALLEERGLEVPESLKRIFR
jgi:tetratricopeptide (TPR) repeat protein